MSEARTPEEDAISAADTGDPEEAQPQEYDGPDPEEDPKGDGEPEDQGT
jgi:hypothetical protein